MEFQDPKVKLESELDVLFKERETALAQDPNTPSDPGEPPTAPASPASGEPQPPAAPTEKTPDELLAAATHRLDTLQGKYNAEIPRLNVTVRQQAAEIARLNAALLAAQESPAPKDGTESDPYRQLVEEYGEGAASATLEMARSEATRASAKVTEEKVVPLEAAFEKNALHVDIAKLAGPDWEQVNLDPKFVGWTHATVEQISGMTVNALLNDAYVSGDASRVAEIFNDYRQETAKTPSTTQTPPVQTQPMTDQEAMQAQPNRGSASQSLTDGTPEKVWTMAEVTSFYDAQAKGRYQGREKQAQALEGEIMAAMQHGRVLGQ